MSSLIWRCACGGFGFAADGISAALRQRGGAAICWKGPDIVQEAENARKAIFLLGGKAREPIAYQVPERDWQHCLFVVDKGFRHAEGISRKAGTPVKKPP